MALQKKTRLVYDNGYGKKLIMLAKNFKLLISFFIISVSCEEKISESDLNNYKSIMDVRLGHLGNAIILQGRLLDAFNLKNYKS